MTTNARLPLLLAIAATFAVLLTTMLNAAQPTQPPQLAAAEAEAVIPRPIWTTIGSTGTPDESSKPKLKFTENRALVKSSGRVFLRYDIHPNTDVAAEGNGLAVYVRFQDNGSKARVRLWLRELNVWEGTIRTVGWFDSNWYTARPEPQIKAVGLCDFEFNVTNNVYYLEAELERNNAHGRPALDAVQIFPYVCE